MTPQQFIKKWTASTLTERSGAQQHFVDLCELLGVPPPAEADPDGKWFAFERGAKKAGGGDGWADVWRKDHFAWEYKGKRKDLDAAYAQLQRYAPALDNPPLLVVSDMERIRIHTNFTSTIHLQHDILLKEISSEDSLQKLKWLFSEPERLKPGKTKAALTEEAAQQFASLAEILRNRGEDSQRVAHFLNRILFCLFAQHAKLLPEKIVDRLLEAGLKRPEHSNRMLRALFGAMKDGGEFGHHVIEWFNGHLFESADAIALEAADIKALLSVADLDWSAIEPSIFGTLFERGMDPDKRSQIGAHYTDPKSIMQIVTPVVIDPLMVEWKNAEVEIADVIAKAERTRDRSASTRFRKQAQQLFNGFLRNLAEFQVLDPACGSGNFLYLALQALKDLEHKATLRAEQLGLEPPLEGMHVDVKNLRGIELNRYAAELARVTVWIGEIQWMLRHGMQPSSNPILKPLKQAIECRDAVLARDGGEAQWPPANAIIGNPPFLGDKWMREGLGDDYTDRLRRAYAGRVPGGADLVTYWFEKGRQQLELKNADRVGFVATNSIRQKGNRPVLRRIEETGRIFEAWSDQPWVNEGAAVRVSIVCYDGKKSTADCTLDGLKVPRIHADLTGSLDLTQAKRQPENIGRSFFGLCLAGPFAVDGAMARSWLALPKNPGGMRNSDVVRPIYNGIDVTKRPKDRWVIDFGPEMNEKQASAYEAPFEYVKKMVRPTRAGNREKSRSMRWWRLGRSRPELRRALTGLSRYIATPETSKHRYFIWLPVSVAPEHRLVVIAREDDVTMGILSSRFHRIWALAVGGTLEDRPVYNSTSCFDTFPFPDGLTLDHKTTEYDNPAASTVADASKRLMGLREEWLNPDDWVERQREPVAGLPDRVVAKKGHEHELKARTLTALYNGNPHWLSTAHAELDAAVARAYGWQDYGPDMPDDAIIARLLKLNRKRAPDLFTSSEKHLALVRTKERRKPPVAKAGVRRAKSAAA